MAFSSLIRKLVHAINHNSLHTPWQSSWEARTEKLSPSLDENIRGIKETLSKSDDLKLQEYRFGQEGSFRCVLVYVDGLADKKTITEGILTPLSSQKSQALHPGKADQWLQILREGVLCIGGIQEAWDKNAIINACLAGDTALLIDGSKGALLIDTKGGQKRGVEEPQTELVVRGPREGFTEDLITNTSLLRRRIKHPHLKMEQFTIGRKSRTGVCLVYVEKVAKEETVTLLKERLSKLDVDIILDSGYIEEYIEDYPFSLFPTMGFSEKPDVVAGKLLDGRVAIVVEGSPFVLTAPFLLIESFQTAEDYYTRPLYANITRIVRLLAFIFSIFTVPVYIAFTTFHQELIPLTLLLRFAGASEGTPFPGIIEALIMVFSFEILREAGLRMPRPVGQAISIVGALIMGDAAVAAGLVGAPMVIAVAFTAVAGFIIPSLIDTISLLRILLIILSAVLGGFGIAMGFLGILVHLATLKSFGVDYFSTVIPSTDVKDSFIRMPLWSTSGRSPRLSGEDRTNKKPFVPPNPPVKEQGKQES